MFFYVALTQCKGLFIIKYSINHGRMTVGQSPPIDLDKENTKKSLTQYYTVIWKCIKVTIKWSINQKVYNNNELYINKKIL